MTFVTVACSNPSTSALSSLQDAICPATSYKYKGKEFSAKKKVGLRKERVVKKPCYLWECIFYSAVHISWVVAAASSS
jgi:hypothetical protein